MTIVHTQDYPKHKGELEVAKQLATFPDQKLHIWCSLDHIPGIRDIDLLLWHEASGVFVVEIKAIPLSHILQFSYSRCKIKDRNSEKTPQQQAYEALLSLRNYLEPRVSKLPYFVATACWPLIRRGEWKRQFSQSSDIAALSDAMIFHDDLYASHEVLLERLRLIWKGPPVRGGASYAFRHDSQQLTAVAQALNPSVAPKPGMSDLARLDALEKGVKKDLIRTFPPGDERKALFVGHPGTGKTFRLLQIAIAHAREDRRVLFSCFNKVLAADIRRLVYLLDKQQETSSLVPSLRANIDVVDIFDLATRAFMAQRLRVETSDHDEWGELLVAEIKRDRHDVDMALYDTVLIDEGQDFKGWQFELLSIHAVQRGTICAAVGTGQELYGRSDELSDWLQTFMAQGAKQFSLRRNFRNTKAIFQLAHVFYEAKLNTGKANALIKNLKRSDNQTQFSMDFDRQTYGGISLVNIDESTMPDYDSPNFSEQQDAYMSAEYFRLICRELRQMDQNNRPTDLLILVPNTVGAETRWARNALLKIKSSEGIGFIDYTNDQFRRDIAPDDQIRLSTFHSSRGLEGVHVLIFGIERIIQVGDRIKADPFRLGYITLSRAIFECVIAVRRVISGDVVSFLEKSIAAITDAESLS